MATYQTDDNAAIVVELPKIHGLTHTNHAAATTCDDELRPECCDDELRPDLTRSNGVSMVGGTEVNVFAAMKARVVPSENIMVAR